MIANTLGFVEINLIQVLGNWDTNQKHQIDYALIVILSSLVLATLILLFVKNENPSRESIIHDFDKI